MKRNDGFSLVELMVAMVVGLIIILGAGQLFLTVFKTNQQVRVLSEKQAAVNFAVEALLRDVRRANHDPIKNPNPWKAEDGVFTLTLTVPNRSDVAGCDKGDPVTKKYALNVSDEVFLNLKMICGTITPPQDDIVGGFVESDDSGNPGFHVDDTDWADDGVLKITFRLVPTDDSGNPDMLTFIAVNRNSAVTN